MSISPYDAWVLAPLLIGADCTGDLVNVSEPWRPLASLWNAMRRAERLSPWQ